MGIILLHLICDRPQQGRAPCSFAGAAQHDGRYQGAYNNAVHSAETLPTSPQSCGTSALGLLLLQRWSCLPLPARYLIMTELLRVRYGPAIGRRQECYCHVPHRTGWRPRSARSLGTSQSLPALLCTRQEVSNLLGRIGPASMGSIGLQETEFHQSNIISRSALRNTYSKSP